MSLNMRGALRARFIQCRRRLPPAAAACRQIASAQPLPTDPTDRTLRAFTLSEEEEELAEHAALTSPQNGSSSHRQQVRGGWGVATVLPLFNCALLL